MYKPDLLAPAGSFDKLKTAFHFGADAVYLGGKNFSLRSYADNFDGFVPYRESTNTSDVRISYDYIPYGTTLSNSADARLSYSSLDSVSLKTLESLKELQQFCWNVQFKYNKKSKIFYNKI